MLEQGTAVGFVKISSTRFDSLTEKSEGTIYFVEDSTNGNQIYLGDTLYSKVYPDGDNTAYGS